MSANGTTTPLARPPEREQARRRREFIRLVAHGASLKDAAVESRMSPWRALELADSPEMVALLKEFRPGDWRTARDG